MGDGPERTLLSCSGAAPQTVVFFTHTNPLKKEAPPKGSDNKKQKTTKKKQTKNNKTIYRLNKKAMGAKSYFGPPAAAAIKAFVGGVGPRAQPKVKSKTMSPGSSKPMKKLTTKLVLDVAEPKEKNELSKFTTTSKHT